MLRPFMCVPEDKIAQLASILMCQQQPSGGIPTAHGLGRKGSTRAPTGLPDFRDVLPVAGWVDKAFRALSLLLEDHNQVPFLSGEQPPTSVSCLWKGKRCEYRESSSEIRLDNARTGLPLYVWRKGEHYPMVYEL